MRQILPPLIVGTILFTVIVGAVYWLAGFNQPGWLLAAGAAYFYGRLDGTLWMRRAYRNRLTLLHVTAKKTNNSKDLENNNV